MKATIDRFEGDKAVLVFNEGQQLVVNKSDLPAESRESDILTISFSAEAQAKSVLNEILKTNDNEA